MANPFSWKTPGLWARFRRGEAMARVEATLRSAEEAQREATIHQMSVELFKEALNSPRINSYYNFEPFCSKYRLQVCVGNDPRAMVTQVLKEAGAPDHLAKASITDYLSAKK